MKYITLFFIALTFSFSAHAVSTDNVVSFFGVNVNERINETSYKVHIESIEKNTHLEEFKHLNTNSSLFKERFSVKVNDKKIPIYFSKSFSYSVYSIADKHYALLTESLTNKYKNTKFTTHLTEGVKHFKGKVGRFNIDITFEEYYRSEGGLNYFINVIYEDDESIEHLLESIKDNL